MSNIDMPKVITSRKTDDTICVLSTNSRKEIVATHVLDQIVDIVKIDNALIQEDVIKYKMICGVLENYGYLKEDKNG